MSVQNDKAIRLADVPGHMRRAAREIIEACANMDFVVVAVDARAPATTDNPRFRELIPELPVLLVAIKADLAPLDNRDLRFLYVSTKKGSDISLVHNALNKLLAERVRMRKQAGMVRVKSYGIVIGLPNVGKSSLINFLARSRRADAQNRPGVTKRQQWIKVSDELELWDTPGVLPNRTERESDKHVAVILNLVPYDEVEAHQAFDWLFRRTDLNFASAVCKTYGILDQSDFANFLYSLATARGFLIKGGLPDLPRTLLLLFKDFNEGRLGKYRLD